MKDQNIIGILEGGPVARLSGGGLAALRERLAEEETPALRRLWRAAGALVSSMAAAVVLLTALTVAGPQLGLTPDEEVASAPDLYSAELLAPAETADGEID